MPTVDLLRLAEILDGAGFAYLEVSGGGVFDTAVRRGVESPWERIRALNSRTKTPLAMALRGRFLVGSRPVGGDFVRRFVASAAESGIEVFRLHDPLNDVENLREAGEAITAAGKRVRRRARLRLRPHGRARDARRAGAQAARARRRRACSSTTRRARSSRTARRSWPLRCSTRAASRSGSTARARPATRWPPALEAARGGADLIACAVYPVALTIHRVSGEAIAKALAGLGLDTGVDVDALWKASELVDEHIGDEPVTPLAPRIAVRAAEHRMPSGLVAALDAQLRAQRGRRPSRRGARRAGPDPRGGRLAAARRADRPDPRLAGAGPRPLGQRATRWCRRAARPDRGPLRQRRPARSTRPSGARSQLTAGDAPAEEEALDARRGSRARRRARSERGGAAPARALRRGGRAAAARDPRPCAARREPLGRRRRPGPGRADPRDRPHRPGVGRRRGDGRGGRHPGHRPPHAGTAPAGARRSRRCRRGHRPARRSVRRNATASSASRRRWSASSTARRSPGAPPFVEEGDTVAPGPDALHPRGDEADERGQGRGRGHRPADLRRATPSRSSSASSCSSSSRVVGRRSAV